MDEELTNTLRSAATRKGLHIVVYPPLVGASYAVHHCLEKLSRDGASQRAAGAITPGLDSWNSALSKYHKSEEDREKSEAKSAEWGGSVIAEYVDLRGIFQRSLLLIALSKALKIPTPASLESLECSVRDEFLRTQMPFNILILDHLSRQAAQELCDLIDFSSATFGVVFLCPIVAGLRDVLQSDNVSAEDVLRQSDQAHQSVESLMELELKAFTDLPRRSHPSDFASRVLLYTHAMTASETKELVAAQRSGDSKRTLLIEFSHLVLELSVGIPGLAAILCRLSIEALRVIASRVGLSSRPKPLHKLPDTKLHTASRLYLILISVFQAILQSVQMDLAPLIDQVNTYALVYTRVASSASGEGGVDEEDDDNGEGKDGIALGYESIWVRRGSYAKEIHDSFERLGMVIQPRWASQVRANDSSPDSLVEPREQDDDYVIPQHIVSILHLKSFSEQIAAADPVQTLFASPFFQDVHASVCKLALRHLLHSFAGIGKTPPPYSFGYYWKLQLWYDLLFDQIGVEHSSDQPSVEAFSITYMLLVANPTTLNLFNSVYERVLLIDHASQVEMDLIRVFSISSSVLKPFLLDKQADGAYVSVEECNGLLMLAYISSVQDALTTLQSNVYSNANTALHRQSLFSKAQECAQTVSIYLDHLFRHLPVLLAQWIHCSSHCVEQIVNMLTIKHTVADLFLRLICAYYQSKAVVSLTPTEQDKLALLLNEMENLWQQAGPQSKIARQLYLSMMPLLVSMLVIYNNILAFQNKMLLYQLLINETHSFYGLHQQLLIMNMVQNDLSCTVSVLDLYVLLHSTYKHLKPTYKRMHILFRDDSMPEPMAEDQESGMAVFREHALIPPSPHTPTNRRNTPRSPVWGSGSAASAAPVHIDGLVPHLLRMLDNAIPGENGTARKTLAGKRPTILRAYLAFSLSGGSRLGVETIAEGMGAVNEYIDQYIEALLDIENLVEQPVIAHSYFGLALYLQLLYLLHNPDHPLHGVQHRQVFRLEQYLSIYQKYQMTHHHKALFVLLTMLFVNMVAETRYSSRNLDVVLKDMLEYRQHVTNELSGHSMLYADRNQGSKPANVTFADSIFLLYREQVYLIRSFFYLQHSIQLAGHGFELSNRFDDALQLYQQQVLSFQSQRQLIRSIVHNKAFNQYLHPEDYNLAIEIANVLVLMGNALYKKALMLAGNTYKYSFQYSSSALSLFPSVARNDVADSSTLSISFTLYEHICRCYKYACYLYDMEYRPRQSAIFIYKIFLLIIALHRQQQLFGICKVYYDNILKLCTEVNFLDMYTIIRLYREYGQILLSNQDWDEAMVIFGLAINEYKNLILKHVLLHSPAVETEQKETTSNTAHGSGPSRIPPLSLSTGKAVTSRIPHAEGGAPLHPPSLFLNEMELQAQRLASMHPLSGDTAPLDVLRHVHEDAELLRLHEEMLDCVVCKCQLYVQGKQMLEAEDYIQFCLNRFLHLHTSDPADIASLVDAMASSCTLRDRQGGRQAEQDTRPSPSSPTPASLSSPSPSDAADAEGEGLNVNIPLLKRLRVVQLNQRSIGNLLKILSIYATIYYHHEEYAEALIFYHIAFQLLILKCQAVYETAQLVIHESLEDVLQAVNAQDTYSIIYANPRCEKKETARLLHNMGLVLLAMGQSREAKEMLERSLAVLLRRYSDDYPQILSVMEALSVALQDLQSFAEADELDAYAKTLHERMETQAQAGQEHLLRVERKVKNSKMSEINWSALVGDLLTREDDPDDEGEGEEEGEGEGDGRAGASRGKAREYIYRNKRQGTGAGSIIDEEVGEATLPRASSLRQPVSQTEGGVGGGLGWLTVGELFASLTRAVIPSSAATGPEAKQKQGSLASGKEARFRVAAGKLRKRSNSRNLQSSSVSRQGSSQDSFDSVVHRVLNRQTSSRDSYDGERADSVSSRSRRRKESYDSDAASDASDAESRRQHAERVRQDESVDEEETTSGCILA